MQSFILCVLHRCLYLLKLQCQDFGGNFSSKKLIIDEKITRLQKIINQFFRFEVIGVIAVNGHFGEILLRIFLEIFKKFTFQLVVA